MTKNEAPYTVVDGELAPANESRLRRDMRRRKAAKENRRILRWIDGQLKAQRS